MAATDEQIRAAIAGLISGVYPTARVWPYFALGHKRENWPGLFRTEDGGTHGWIVKRASMLAEWKSVYRDRKTVIYDIWGFYGFRQGKAGDNSDDEFAEICDAVYDAFKASPKLGIDCLGGHELLQFTAIGTLACGEETLHFAQGQLALEPCC